MNNLIGQLRLLNDIMAGIERPRQHDTPFKIVGFGYDPFVHKHVWTIKNTDKNIVFKMETTKLDTPTEFKIWKHWFQIKNGAGD
jgi:hypothetical protein